MLGRWLLVAVAVVTVCTIEFLLIRSSVSAFRADLQQRPNCALVDDAMREGRVPDAKVRASCRASARGLVYSLTPQDRALLRAGAHRR